MKRRSNELPDINTNADPSISNDVFCTRQEDVIKADDSLDDDSVKLLKEAVAGTKLLGSINNEPSPVIN